jgi:hypothetical protein
MTAGNAGLLGRRPSALASVAIALAIAALAYRTSTRCALSS